MTDNRDIHHAERYRAVCEHIRIAEQRFNREEGSVSLLAVSKTRPAADIARLAELGQRQFGESYLQEALGKIEELATLDLEWHFIGPIQSNKTQSISNHFDWVHSVDRFKIARRLSEQRPDTLPPLNICLQVNISHEESKSGVTPADLPELVTAIEKLPRLRLRGLMAIPARSDSVEEQRKAFRAMHKLWQQLNDAGHEMDTLSMGMSGDLEAAIAEGATMVRIGTALFGPRT